MTCVNCRNRIEKKLKSMAGVEDAAVDYAAGTAKVSYDEAALTPDSITGAIESLGYTTPEKNLPGRTALQIAGTLAVILALYMLLRMFSTSSLAAAFPVARSGMGYGMVLIIGLVTSVHCLAMCGGINLSQTWGSREWGVGSRDRGSLSERDSNPLSQETNLPIPHSLFPAILYNTGRLISYTAVGAAVGALGSVVTVAGRFQGAVLLIAGIFMLIMGLNMLGLFPALGRLIPHIPPKLRGWLTSLFSKKAGGQTGRGPLLIGILNGFMPCGPLQAMQLYALSTGSPIKGGVSMFVFCLGTIPLMFALGAAGSIASGAKGQAFSRQVMRAGAVLIAAMGLAMFTNGWNLAGLESPLARIAAVFNPAETAGGAQGAARGGAFTPVIQDGAQIVNSTLLPNRYPAITVQQGIPVRWTINAPPNSINGCNNRIFIREYGISHTFSPGENMIEFTPEKTGRFSYSCWMGMIRSSITVVAKGESIAAVPEPNTTPVPAGVNIPTDEIALAQITGNTQTVEIRLTDDGFEPAIVVMQRQTPTVWNINVDSLDPGSTTLIFPAYYAILETEQGNNAIRIIPDDDFEFSTGDNVFYGYVKVVDDINRADIDAIKAEVAEHETLIYPEAYFEYN